MTTFSSSVIGYDITVKTKYFTAWNVSVSGVILVCIFPHLFWITPDTDTFYVVFDIRCKILYQRTSCRLLCKVARKVCLIKLENRNTTNMSTICSMLTERHRNYVNGVFLVSLLLLVGPFLHSASWKFSPHIACMLNILVSEFFNLVLMILWSNIQ